MYELVDRYIDKDIPIHQHHRSDLRGRRIQHFMQNRVNKRTFSLSLELGAGETAGISLSVLEHIAGRGCLPLEPGLVRCVVIHALQQLGRSEELGVLLQGREGWAVGHKALLAGEIGGLSLELLFEQIQSVTFLKQAQHT